MPSNEFWPHIDYTQETLVVSIPAEPEQPTTDEKCLMCGLRYKMHYKFNGGNPVWVALAECSCEEDAAFDEMVERMKDRVEQVRYNNNA